MPEYPVAKMPCFTLWRHRWIITAPTSVTTRVGSMWAFMQTKPRPAPETAGRTFSGCPTRHYVRADAIEQVVKLELQRMAQFLRDDEPMFADLLERKSNREIAEEKKRLEGELQKARMRTETVSRLYKKAFEKNAEGLLSDEGFLQITHEYDIEQLALKAKIPQLREQIAEAERQAANKDKFIAAIRKFMQMDELTAPLLRELIDHIEIYETQGTGKSRTQRITIYYRFVGYIDIPAAPLTNHYISETRQGVAVEYIPA